MTKHFFSLAIAALLLSGCSSNKLTVLTSYDDEADFTSYLTFGVVNYEATQGIDKSPNGFVDQYFEEAIEKEMKDRGYILSDNRDLEIYYYIKVTTETEMVANSTSPYYGGYYGSPYYHGYYGGYGYGSVGIGVSTTTVQEVDHHEGTLIIDIVDVRADKVVWRGTAQKSINNSGGDQRIINQVINRVFYDYKWTVGEVAAEEKK
jgi:hypothetical protein